MTRAEFLQELREALVGKLSASEIESNIEYYNSYINEEIGKGKAEVEVLEELGSPFAIAKTISMSHESTTKECYEEEPKSTPQKQTGRKMNSKGLVFVLLLVLLFLIFFPLVFSLLAIAVRFAVPIAVILLVVYLLKKK